MYSTLWITYWLFTQTLYVILHVWPVSVFLALNATGSVAFSQVPRTTERFLATLSCFIWPPLILGVAGACWYTFPRISASVIPTIGITIIFGIQLLLSIGIIYQLAGNRWFAASVSLIAGWFGLISWFLAGMALTNVGL